MLIILRIVAYFVIYYNIINYLNLHNVRIYFNIDKLINCKLISIPTYLIIKFCFKSLKIFELIFKSFIIRIVHL